MSNETTPITLNITVNIPNTLIEKLTQAFVIQPSVDNHAVTQKVTRTETPEAVDDKPKKRKRRTKAEIQAAKAAKEVDESLEDKSIDEIESELFDEPTQELSSDVDDELDEIIDEITGDHIVPGSPCDDDDDDDDFADDMDNHNEHSISDIKKLLKEKVKTVGRKALIDHLSENDLIPSGLSRTPKLTEITEKLESSKYDAFYEAVSQVESEKSEEKENTKKEAKKAASGPSATEVEQKLRAFHKSSSDKTIARGLLSKYKIKTPGEISTLSGKKLKEFAEELASIINDNDDF